jgi:hypothetical protein
MLATGPRIKSRDGHGESAIAHVRIINGQAAALRYEIGIPKIEFCGLEDV